MKTLIPILSLALAAPVLGQARRQPGGGSRSQLVGVTTRALGVATHGDLVEYQRLNGPGRTVSSLDAAAVAAGLTKVTVAGGKSTSKTISVS